MNTLSADHKKSDSIIYLIRHGEKPPKNPDGTDQDGLSTMGIERAQGLRKTFGVESPYNIKCIIAQKPKKDGGRARPYLTVLPLSEDLGLKIDKSIDRDDAKDCAKAAKKFKGPGNVLICWEHKTLTDIVEELGVEKPFEYPGDRFDLIYSVQKPYNTLVLVGGEHVAGLDDQRNAGDGFFGALPSEGINGVATLPADPIKGVTSVVVSAIPVSP